MSTDESGASDRLCLATLDRLPSSVRRPGFDPTALGIGIVHLGVGAFHRAHQAVYTEDALAHGRGQWGILGISLRRPDAAQRLLPQNCLYTIECLGEGAEYRVMGVLRHVVTAPEQPQAVSEAIAASYVHIVTLTVTEKGYALNTEGALDANHPDISADLHGATTPKSTLGWLMRGLVKRWHTGGRPLTILSCDNVSKNGSKLRSALLQFAGKIDRDIARWIEAELRFPNTVVDCMVPATDAAAVSRVTAALGLVDAASVQREDFSQWVIENSFAGPRPSWEAAGVQIVDNVVDHEKLKLHVLNATHSALAYVTPPGGHRYVREAIADTGLSTFLDEMVTREIQPAFPSLRVVDYWSQTKRRFANPSIQHALSQIAEDGSAKLAQRIFPVLIANARAGRPTRCLATVVRAWLEHARHAVKDPKSEQLDRWSKSGGEFAAALDDPALFPEPFRAESLVRSAVIGVQ